MIDSAATDHCYTPSWCKCPDEPKCQLCKQGHCPVEPETSDASRLTVTDAAQHCGVTTRTIRRWIAHGLPTRTHAGRVYVDLAALNQREAATRRHGGKPRKWAHGRSVVIP